MEDILRPISCKPISPPLLGMHKDSHVINKVKPKVRIIHIFAPEIIKTDVANFRELVQRLTGKPGEQENKKVRAKRRRIAASASKKEQKGCHGFWSNEPNKKSTLQLEGQGLPNVNKVEKIKVEVGHGHRIWGAASSSSSGFLDGFCDLNHGFMHGLCDGFPMTNAPSMDLFGDIRFS